GRFLAARPVLARPAPLWERPAKWARRHPAAAGLLLGALAVALAVLVVWRRAAADERSRLAAARREVGGRLLEGQRAFGRADWSGARSHAAAALARLGPEPSLGDLRPGAEELLAQAESR